MSNHELIGRMQEYPILYPLPVEGVCCDVLWSIKRISRAEFLFNSSVLSSIVFDLLGPACIQDLKSEHARHGFWRLPPLPPS